MDISEFFLFLITLHYGEFNYNTVQYHTDNSVHFICGKEIIIGQFGRMRSNIDCD